MAKTYEERRWREQAEKNWKGKDVYRPPGVEQWVLDTETRAYVYCDGQGHHTRGDQACRACLQEFLMGRDPSVAPTLAPLPSAGVEPVCRILDGILGDFGRYGKDSLLAKVNEQRAAQRKDPYEMPALTARLRQLRDYGRTVHHTREADGDVYWYEKPGQPAAAMGESIV